MIFDTSNQNMNQLIDQFGDLKVQKLAGNGKTADVYSCLNSLNEEFALKQYREYRSADFDLQNEIKAFQILNHPNILKMLGYQNRKIFVELCKNGELYDYVASVDHFPEELARYYFRQLITAIEHCHQNGIVHRDIKLENMLLDDNYNLKLCDFAFSMKLENKSTVLTRIIGTEGYMAPELIQGAYYGEAVDVFACGVTLFCMMTGTTPFIKQACKLDPYYKFIMENNFSKYWSLVERQQQREFSKEFKNLITGMLAAQPDRRLSVKEIKENPWFNQDTFTNQEAVEYMQASKTQTQDEKIPERFNRNKQFMAR